MACIFCVAEFPHEPTDMCIESVEEIKQKVGAAFKDGEDMADPISTGRKRAAIIAPIPVGMVCEWKRLTHAGGGPVPIKGCPGNPATDRHHGPDKSVLNNELNINLHRICSVCHNRWHTANDKYYGAGKEDRPMAGMAWLPQEALMKDLVLLPHNAESKMSQQEALMTEAMRNQEDRRGK